LPETEFFFDKNFKRLGIFASLCSAGNCGMDDDWKRRSTVIGGNYNVSRLGDPAMPYRLQSLLAPEIALAGRGSHDLATFWIQQVIEGAPPE
jgi:hypothetical protein